MPPVTRSTRRNLPTFLQELSARPSTTSPPLRLSEPTRTGWPGLLDWITITPALLWDHAKQTDAIDEFFDQLRGCFSTVNLRLQRSCSLEAPNTEYVMIEWNNASTRAKFIASDNYTTLMDLLAQLTQGRSVHLSLVDFSSTNTYAFHPDKRGPVDHFELLTVYFPGHLSESQRQAISRRDGPFSVRGWLPGQPYEEIEPHPLHQLVDSTCGWLVHPPAVDFRAHRGAQCLVYFLRWNGRAGEKSYKSIHETRTVDWWGEFLARLEALGMLGCESQHVRFYRRSH